MVVIFAVLLEHDGQLPASAPGNLICDCNHFAMRAAPVVPARYKASTGGPCGATSRPQTTGRPDRTA